MKKLKQLERFYLKSLELEMNSIRKVSSYKESEKGF